MGKNIRRFALHMVALMAGGVIWIANRSEGAIPRSALRPPVNRNELPERDLKSAQRERANALPEPTRSDLAIGIPRIKPFELKPRSKNEWQGMLVATNVAPPCGSSAHCGMARTCVGGTCVGCESDSQCEDTAVCVLDHCVSKKLAHCRRKSECPGAHFCILSGYSPGPRGNADMTSFCSDSASGDSTRPDDDSLKPVGSPAASSLQARPDDPGEAARIGRKAAISKTAR